MTKITVFGQEGKKAIEFVYILDSKEGVQSVACAPGSFDNLCLLGKAFRDNYDFIMAWDDDDSDLRYIYLGHWNDGVV